MAGRSRVTREAIVECGARIVARDGPGALTFQALATALGVSKQAIIYWYPSKWELVLDLALSGLRGEAEAVIAAIAGAGSAPTAIGRFVRALATYHLADLGRFRALYLSPQFSRRADLPENADAFLTPIHATTAPMYAALASAIAADATFRPREDPRRLAVAAHAAGIGLLTMLALAESVEDPLAHGTDALVDALVALLTGPAGPAQ
jgi:AcrR family transcriptional regulator